MHDIWETLRHFIDPELLLREGGLYVLLFVVFAETGLFFGFFLPGDYLLFLAGMFTVTNRLNTSIYLLIIGLIIAAVLGNFIGYWFGKKAGRVLYDRPDTFFFKKKHLKAAENYYRKQGALALIMGRFIPIVRTFAPIFAGIVKLEFKKFAFYNIFGAVLWVTSLTLIGFFLGIKFEKEITDYLLYIIVGFIVITALPLFISYIKGAIGISKVEEEV